MANIEIDIIRSIRRRFSDEECKQIFHDIFDTYGYMRYQQGYYDSENGYERDPKIIQYFPQSSKPKVNES